jgi:ribosome biogenesis GTPase
MLAVIASVGTPRYRPNFVDRVLVMAEMEHLSAAIVVNKADRGVTEDAFKHIELLRAIDYPVYAVAARAADAGRFPDFDRLVRRLDTCHVVLIGQSGVGKSTLINRLVPDAGLAVGEVSDKYHRGRHTTTLARQVAVPAAAAELSSSTVLTDTPGVKEFDLGAYSLREIAFGFREFRDPAEHCRIRECTHTHEPDCGVRAAVERNVVSGRRYESYCRILSDIEEHR